jgi:hypothetical protein
MDNAYLSSVLGQFRHYKSLGEGAMNQAADADLCWKPDETSNSIAVIVKHVSGNMLSRWTDIFETDGEKEWRNRDAEFVGDIETRDDLMDVWERGWRCLFSTLESLTEKDLERIIYIRGEAHTVVSAINRQLAHYPYHVGQMVYIVKMRAAGWSSLSIPLHQSEAFNREKFKQGRKD